MNWMKVTIAVVCSVIMLSVALSPACSSGERTVRAIIMKDARSPIEIDAEEDYGAFVLANLPESHFERLHAAGWVLDVLPEQARRIEVIPGTNDYEVVFKGPVKSAWLDSLTSSGAIMTPVLSPSSKYGYVVIAPEDSARAIASIPSVVGVFPYPDKFYGDIPASGPVKVVITFFPGHGGSWGRVLQSFDDPKWGGYIVTELEASSLETIAKDPRVARIEQYYPVKIISDRPSNEPLNDISRWVIQSFIDGKTPVWDNGIHGEGIVVGCSDTGVDYDHMNFRDTMNDMGTPGPNHRKVVKLTNYAGNGEDSMPHGSHVVGTILGKSMTDPSNYVQNDGMAYNAKASFMDIFDLDKTQDEMMPPMKEMLDDMYSAGARSHSGSWGGYSNQSSGAYSWRSLGADQYMWDHPDFLGIWAAGNSGPGTGTVIEPGTAKSIVTAGAAYNGNRKDLASFSSNGPTKDGIRKPTVVAPGVGITSVSGDTTLGNYNSGFQGMSGTSMATPTTSGGTALVEQYFRDGFYPSGKMNQADGFMPSAALRKAILINSAWDQFGGSNVDDHMPDNSQGWGKIKLDDALFFDGDARKLWIDDAAYSQGINTGDKIEYTVNANSGQPLKFTLVYNDYPGNGLKNDLDLRATAPDQSLYLGNVFTNGESTTGGQPETANNDEQVLITSPAQGKWSVEILASNVPKGPQPYSFVVTGDIASASKNSSSSGPSVLSTDPKNKASSVPLTTSISIAFDKPMKTQSAESAFSTSPSTNGTFSWNSNTMAYKPSKPLSFNTTYTVTELKNASDTNGTQMNNDYVFSFKTEDIVPVEILGTIPLDGAKDVSLTSTIRVVFNRGVVAASAEAAFSIFPVVPGSFSWPNNYTMVLTPGGNLKETTQYNAKVTKSVQDMKGNTMLDDYPFSFRTGLAPDITPPTVKISQPSNGATVSGETLVKADVTDDRNIAKVDFYLDGEWTTSGSRAPFVWTWDASPIANGAHTIKAQAFDDAGNTASDEISVNVANDLTPPTVTGTDPKDKSTGVGLDAKISITFSEEMDPISVQAAFSILPDITGNFSWSGNTVTFTPSTSLLTGMTYTVKISTNARDINGNKLQSEYSFSFDTSKKGTTIDIDMMLYLIPIIAIVAIVAIIAVLLSRRRKRRPEYDAQSPMEYGAQPYYPQPQPYPQQPSDAQQQPQGGDQPNW